ncbi:MAG: hypothetical protein ACO3CD_05975 [Candidatus Nanopelagicaceae bacterium]
MSEAIQQYFDTDASTEIIVDDIIDVLEQSASSYRSKSDKFEEVLSKLK